MDFEKGKQNTLDQKKEEEMKIIEHHGKELLQVCAWCDKEDGIKHVGNVTHGICEKHKQQLMEEIENME